MSKIRYHYDCEFKENGETIKLLSFGMVSDDNRELYMINRPEVDKLKDRLYLGDADETDLWLEKNVLAYMPQADIDKFGYDKKTKMAKALFDFMINDLDWSSSRHIELWGYFAAYDHVCLAQLFGKMLDLAPGIPMWTNDLMTIGHIGSGFFKPKPQRPKDLPEHNALADAKYQKLIFEAWND